MYQRLFLLFAVRRLIITTNGSDNPRELTMNDVSAPKVSVRIRPVRKHKLSTLSPETVGAVFVCESQGARQGKVECPTG